MKLITIMSLLISSSSILFASSEVDTSVTYRKSDSSMNNIHIYNFDSKKQYRMRLKFSLVVYDNYDLKGNPTFTIDNEKVIDLKNNKKMEYFFKDYLKHDKHQHSSEIRNLPFDFIVASTQGYYLAVKEYHDGIATIQENNKMFFLKLQESNFEGDNWPESSLWMKQRDKGVVQVFIKKLETEDKAFFELVESIRKCINEKNLKCFEAKIESARIGNFEREVSEWSISNDKALCEKLDHHAINNDLISQIKERIIPWGLFQKITNFSDSSVSYELTNKDFGKTIKIGMSIDGDCACDTCLGIKIVFTHEIGKPWIFSLIKIIGEDGP